MKKLFVSLLAVLLLVPTVASAGGWMYPNSSGWAKDELDDAMINGITTQQYDNYQRNITRAEFAEIIMNLYYEMKGSSPEINDYSVFSDTDDASVLSAYRLGIITGKGNGIFAPNDAITRQEMAIMMKRTIDTLGINYSPVDGALTVSDQDKVASWAKGGVDFAFENGFMRGDGISFRPLQTTPIEQAICIANRAFEKYRTLSEPSDYTQGYTTEVTAEGLIVTYKNNGQSELLISFVESNSLKEGGKMYFSGIKTVRTSSTDLTKLHFVDSINRLWFYDFIDNTCFQYTSSYGGALNVKSFEIIASGTYAGYVAVESKSYIADTVTRLVFDRQGAYVGELEMMSDYNYQISEIYSQKEDEKNTFSMQVTNAVNFPGTISISEKEMYFFSSANHESYVKNGVGYLRLYPNALEDNAYTGPIGRAGSDRNTQFGYNGYGGIYEVDLTFNNVIGNAGIVFNLVATGDGNDNYYGYYVGIDPKNDTVMFGKSQSKWTSLKAVKLNFDVEQYDTVTLKVTKNGSDIWVDVNNTRYITMTDKTFTKDGGFGVRTWKSDVSYSNFTISPLPY